MGKNDDINSTTLNTIRMMIFLPLRNSKKVFPLTPLALTLSLGLRLLLFGYRFLLCSLAIAGHTTQVNFFHVRIRDSVPLLPHFSGALELIVRVNVREPREETSMPMVAREKSVRLDQLDTEAMLDDLDSFDDIPLPTTTTTERRPGKFRPRTRAKTATVASTTPKNSDDAQLVPPSPQPSAQDSDFNLEMERTGHEPGLSNYSVVAGGFLDTSRQSQGSLGQGADACFSLCSPNGPTSTSAGNVEIF
ncbi:uncharacterized protein LOC135585739 isoform X3 [Musa acuminata AAA Group]|uniref:uncharacterized protein LOC135585739 isoform X3 n=1 Tax=Musa acuminata AAA Group TaxID=214697 RepID=UPI0031D6B078